MTRFQRILRTLTAVAVALAVSPASRAVAQPADPVTGPGDLGLSFSPVPYSFSAGTDVDVALTYPLPQGADWVSLELRLLDTQGRTVLYSSTWVGPQDPTTRTDAVALPLDEENIEPGAYTLSGTATARIDGASVSGQVSTPVAVWNPDAPPVDVVLVARAATMLLADQNGEFTLDPGDHASARQSVEALCDLVVKEPALELTLAIAPAMLEEWADIADGYTRITADSKVDVAADQTTPLAYDLALAKIRQAVATGRLHLAATGYADPDLTTLVSKGLEADVALQLSTGLSVLASSATSTTVTGVVPFRQDAPPALDAAMADSGLTWTLLSQRFARSVDETATSGVYDIHRSGSPIALVADQSTADALRDGDGAAAAARALARQIDGPDDPFVVAVDLGAAPSRTAVALCETLATQPWARTLPVDDVLDRSRTAITVLDAEPIESPSGYWDTVAEARSHSRALASLLQGTDSTTPFLSRRLSLSAQSGAWIGSDGSWPRVDIGRRYAEKALATASEILDAVEVRVEPVTLSKNEGEVPLVVTNGTTLTLTVTVVPVPGEGLSVPEELRSTTLVLRPNDNYMTVPVKLENAASGDLTVKVMAGAVPLSEKTVQVKGSLLDRIVLLGTIAAALVGLLLFVRGRVRSVERAEACGDDGHEA